MLKTLQAGRGLAAFAVAAYHLSIMMSEARYGGVGVFEPFTRYGDLGVDYFFVLSGFVIMFAHAKDIGAPSRLGVYARRRFIRLYPIYWIYTLGFTVLDAAGFGSVKLPDTAASWATALTLIRFDAGHPPLAVAWTLFHEIAFYALFAVLIVNRRAGLILIGLWGAICLALFHYPDPDHRTPLAVYTSAHNLAFLVGVGAYALYRYGRFGALAASAGGAITVAALVAAYTGFGDHRVIFAVGFGLIIGGLASVERGREVKVPRALMLLGAASYTLYLVHESFEGLGLKIAGKLHIPALVGPAGEYGFALVTAVIGGLVAYRLLEEPLLQGLKDGKLSSALASWGQLVPNRRVASPAAASENASS